MSILDQEPVFVGRIEKVPRNALSDRVVKIIFEVPDDREFNLDDHREAVLMALQQVRAMEALLHGFHHGVAIVFASRSAIERMPVLLADDRRYWILGQVQRFRIEDASAGNWFEPEAVLAAKAALGAQIYRLEALLIGAMQNVELNAAGKRSAIYTLFAKLIEPRLLGLLRAAGSRRDGGGWESYVAELRDSHGTPLIRELYGEPKGQRARLAVGTAWQREGRAKPITLTEVEGLNDADPIWGNEIRVLGFAGDLLARAQIEARDGVAQANRSGILSPETMSAIVDIDSDVDPALAVEAAMQWNINPAASFFQLGAYSGVLDAARAIGIYERQKKVVLPGLASFGVRALSRFDRSELFDTGFTELLQSLRLRLSEPIVLAAEQTPFSISGPWDAPS